MAMSAWRISISKFFYVYFILFFIFFPGHGGEGVNTFGISVVVEVVNRELHKVDYGFAIALRPVTIGMPHLLFTVL
jgi:hypothetical protein